VQLLDTIEASDMFSYTIDSTDVTLQQSYKHHAGLIQRTSLQNKILPYFITLPSLQGLSPI
jgi:hypothetical protein